MPGKYVAKQGCAPTTVAHERVRHWKTEVVIGGLEMLSGRGKKEYAKEAQAVAATGEDGLPTAAMAPADGAVDEALVAM